MSGRKTFGDKKRQVMTITIDPSTIEKMEGMAFVLRRSKSQLIDEAISDLYKRLEAERGEPFPRR